MQEIFLSMIVAGMGLLCASLPSIRSILRTLGSGRLRARWEWLRRLIAAFLVGYAAFGIAHIGMQTSAADLIVAAILLSGGAFVLIVARLSEMTTNDIVRIASLERDVMRDPMTGVYNRRYLDSRLDEEISRARRSHSPLSALMVDLDHFKHINDTYGHPVGDEVIRHVSALIMSQVRVSDIMVRYGGEEFLVIATDSALEEVSALGDRLLVQLRSHGVALANGQSLPVTASIGAALLEDAETQGVFLHRADEALYEAKRTGRNRMCIASPMAEVSAS
ncbi:GGDEF domain-containing protein [Sphingobium yanoikuyae]|uniref:GGDEF domain-containing protein n=1 Tax=Sphingobium yanoikuyae TaxID=13690 RepID=UPI0022DE7ED9|nr:GGDEF domain-containing protein [Sphingobium yanoikuyae]WBQ17588.1 GGDEF domain-containing protein [Sphingobium yanoikuyae]